VLLRVGGIGSRRINMAGISLKTIAKMIVNVENRIKSNQQVTESKLKDVYSKLAVVELKIEKQTKLMDMLFVRIQTLMARIDDVIAAVAEETTVIASVGVLLDKLTVAIADLKVDAEDGRVDAAKVDELFASVKANTDILRAAVVKNTPEEGTVDEHGLTM
jgi:predicted transcriptional regulator